MSERSILIVIDDPAERYRIGAWLEDAGFDVICCPGPQAPDYVCLGGRAQPCPLADAASLVVLDLRLASDEVMSGTPGWELLFYYMARGKKIVALSGAEDSVRPESDEDVVVFPRPPSRELLIAAVRGLTKGNDTRRRAG